MLCHVLFSSDRSLFLDCINSLSSTRSFDSSFTINTFSVNLASGIAVNAPRGGSSVRRISEEPRRNNRPTNAFSQPRSNVSANRLATANGGAMTRSNPPSRPASNTGLFQRASSAISNATRSNPGSAPSGNRFSNAIANGASMIRNISSRFANFNSSNQQNGSNSAPSGNRRLVSNAITNGTSMIRSISSRFANFNSSNQQNGSAGAFSLPRVPSGITNLISRSLPTGAPSRSSAPAGAKSGPMNKIKGYLITLVFITK